MATEPLITPIDYTSRDYASLRESLIKSVQKRIPGWTADDPTDFGLAIVESFAYMGDVMSYYIDRAANEAFLATAVQRDSVVGIARTLGYYPSSGTSATVKTRVLNSGPYRVAIIPNTQFIGNAQTQAGVETLTFESTNATLIDVPPSTEFSIYKYQVSSGTFSIQIQGDVVGSNTNTAQMVYAINDTLNISNISTALDGLRSIASGSYDSATGITTITFSGTYSPNVALTTVSGAKVSAWTTLNLKEGSSTSFTDIGISSGAPSQEFYFTAPSLVDNSVKVSVGVISGYTAYPNVTMADPLYGPNRNGYPVWSSGKTDYLRSISTTNLTNTSKVFFLEPGTGNSYIVKFGDGTNGGIPPKDQHIYVSYARGGGVKGNIPAGVTLRGPVTLTAVSTSGATGGSEKESIESIRVNAASVIRTGDRAVSLQDFADLALKDTSVSKANARSGSASSVTVYTAPQASETNLAPGYEYYTVVSRSRNGSNVATLVINNPLSQYASGDTFVGYVSGVGSTFDTGSSAVTFTVGVVTAGSNTRPVTYSSTGSSAASASCLGVITAGVTTGFTSTMTRVSTYLQDRCSYGTTVNVVPVTYKDLYIDVTIKVNKNYQHSVARDRAYEEITNALSFAKAEIGVSAKSREIEFLLAQLNSIDDATVTMFRSTADTVTTTEVTAGAGEILRLLKSTLVASKTSSSNYNTFTYGNLIIRIGSTTGVYDLG